MSKGKYYRQCRYETAFPEAGGPKEWDECWIPEELAQVGKLIYFGDKRKPVSPAEKFRILSVGDTRRNAEWLHNKRAADNKSLPSVRE